MITTIRLNNPSITSSPSFWCVCVCVCMCACVCVLRITKTYSLRFIFIRNIGL